MNSKIKTKLKRSQTERSRQQVINEEKVSVKIKTYEELKDFLG